MSLPDQLEELLPGETAAAWIEIAPLVPATMYLGSGTAIAVHLHHRSSRDLDFFFHATTVDLDSSRRDCARKARSRSRSALPARSTASIGRRASSSCRPASRDPSAASSPLSRSAACRWPGWATCWR